MKNIDSNIKHPAYWDEMERRQKEELENIGLIVSFHHKQNFKPKEKLNRKGEIVEVQVPNPLPLSRTDGEDRQPRFWVGSTIALIYKREDYELAKKEQKFHKLEPVADGISYCSHLDQFNRQIGRVIATERALAVVPR